MTERSERWGNETRDNHCKVIGHDWHVERDGRLRCGNRCWIDRSVYYIVLKEQLDQTAAKIMAVLNLCEDWDAMTKGPSPTTKQIRAALGVDDGREAALPATE